MGSIVPLRQQPVINPDYSQLDIQGINPAHIFDFYKSIAYMQNLELEKSKMMADHVKDIQKDMLGLNMIPRYQKDIQRVFETYKIPELMNNVNTPEGIIKVRNAMNLAYMKEPVMMQAMEEYKLYEKYNKMLQDPQSVAQFGSEGVAKLGSKIADLTRGYDANGTALAPEDNFFSLNVGSFFEGLKLDEFYKEKEYERDLNKENIEYGNLELRRAENERENKKFEQQIKTDAADIAYKEANTAKTKTEDKILNSEYNEEVKEDDIWMKNVPSDTWQWLKAMKKADPEKGGYVYQCMKEGGNFKSCVESYMENQVKNKPIGYDKEGRPIYATPYTQNPNQDELNVTGAPRDEVGTINTRQSKFILPDGEPANIVYKDEETKGGVVSLDDTAVQSVLGNNKAQRIMPIQNGLFLQTTEGKVIAVADDLNYHDNYFKELNDEYGDLNGSGAGTYGEVMEKLLAGEAPASSWKLINGVEIANNMDKSYFGKTFIRGIPHPSGRDNEGSVIRQKEKPHKWTRTFSDGSKHVLYARFENDHTKDVDKKAGPVLPGRFVTNDIHLLRRMGLIDASGKAVEGIAVEVEAQSDGDIKFVIPNAFFDIQAKSAEDGQIRAKKVMDRIGEWKTGKFRYIDPNTTSDVSLSGGEQTAKFISENPAAQQIAQVMQNKKLSDDERNEQLMKMGALPAFNILVPKHAGIRSELNSLSDYTLTVGLDEVLSKSGFKGNLVVTDKDRDHNSDSKHSQNMAIDFSIKENAGETLMQSIANNVDVAKYFIDNDIQILLEHKPGDVKQQAVFETWVEQYLKASGVNVKIIPNDSPLFSAAHIHLEIENKNHVYKPAGTFNTPANGSNTPKTANLTTGDSRTAIGDSIQINIGGVN